MLALTKTKERDTYGFPRNNKESLEYARKGGLLKFKRQIPSRDGGTAIANPKLAEEGTLAKIHKNIKNRFPFRSDN